MSGILKVCKTNIKILNNFTLSKTILKPGTIGRQCYEHIRNSTSVAQPSVLNVNTNVVKDVILFRYDNPKQFKLLNIFAVVQFGFWSYLAITANTTLVDIPVMHDLANQENLPWWQKINLGEKKYRYAITYMCFGIG